LEIATPEGLLGGIIFLDRRYADKAPSWILDEAYTLL